MTTFSVVIPTKNEEEHLQILLSSIRAQTFRPIDIVVADAKSTDKTIEVAKKYGATVVRGGLPGPGRNAGARKAKGEIIFFLDADVELKDRDFFKKVIKEFKEKEFDVATADVSPIEGNAYDKFAHNFYNNYVRLWGRHHPHAPGFFIVIKKELHEKINGFDETVVFAEDHDYAIRANKVGKFGFLSCVKIDVSIRRHERDGRLCIAIKYILAELYILFFGAIRHNAFNYTFGYEKKN